MQTMDIISVNIWQILISLANLLILFFGLKKFLFKPVQKVFKEREEQVKALYTQAEQDKAQAGVMKTAYETRLASAREEADGLVRNAVQNAQMRSEEILTEANTKASQLHKKAQEDILRERQQMLTEVRGEIGDLAITLAEKVIEREINPQDHQRFMDEFIESVGEQP